MRAELNSHIDSYGSKNVDSRFFRGDSRLPMLASDYSTRSARRDGKDSLPNDVLFNPNYTEYCIALQTRRGQKKVDSAVIGFNLENSVLDCLQIQGERGRYKELSPVDWDRALLFEVIMCGLTTHASAVSVIPTSLVECDPLVDYEKLRKRYDVNAKSFGFLYSSEMGRFVLDLK